MPEADELASHEMRPRARFHNDGARLDAGNKLDELFAVEFLSEDFFADLVLTVHMKRMFVQVDTY